MTTVPLLTCASQTPNFLDPTRVLDAHEAKTLSTGLGTYL